MNELIKDKTRSTFRDTISLLIVFACIFFLLICFPSCTESITVISSQGKASDMVDETQTNDPEVDPTLSIPVKAV